MFLVETGMLNQLEVLFFALSQMLHMFFGSPKGPIMTWILHILINYEIDTQNIVNLSTLLL